MGIFEDPRRGIDRRAINDTHVGSGSDQRDGLDRRRNENKNAKSPWWLLRRYVNKTGFMMNPPLGK